MFNSIKIGKTQLFIDKMCICVHQQFHLIERDQMCITLLIQRLRLHLFVYACACTLKEKCMVNVESHLPSKICQTKSPNDVFSLLY